MRKKIVQRVPPSDSDTSDLIGLIDMIEVALGIGTGEPTVSNRLFDVVGEIRRSGGTANSESVSALLEIAERLKKVEQLLADNGFEVGLSE